MTACQELFMYTSILNNIRKYVQNEREKAIIIKCQAEK